MPKCFSTVFSKICVFSRLESVCWILILSYLLNFIRIICNIHVFAKKKVNQKKNPNQNNPQALFSYYEQLKVFASDFKEGGRDWDDQEQEFLLSSLLYFLLYGLFRQLGIKLLCPSEIKLPFKNCNVKIIFTWRKKFYYLH